MEKTHHYSSTVTWTGNLGAGTMDYKGYSRDHIISVPGRPDVPGSSDPAFRGDASRYSPEDSLVAAVSACHMLWYLHLCAVNHVVVEKYTDKAVATMVENPDGSGQFKEIVLKPLVEVRDVTMVTKATTLHHQAHQMCFLARSVNFPIHHEPTITTVQHA